MKFLVFLITISLIIVSLTRVHSLKKSTLQYLNRFQWPVKQTFTRSNNWGGGRTIYLDRHRSNCGIGAVSQFQYKRQKVNGKWTKFRYQTVCIMPKNCINKCPESLKKLDDKLCKYHKTKPDVLGDWGGLSTNYLDRHYVKCPGNFVLNNFKMQTENRKVFYHYRCCPAKVLSCSSYTTPIKSYGNLGNQVLESQVVKVPNIKTMAMTGFRLLTNESQRGFQYHVDYCVVEGR